MINSKIPAEGQEASHDSVYCNYRYVKVILYTEFYDDGQQMKVMDTRGSAPHRTWNRGDMKDRAEISHRARKTWIIL